MNFYEYYQENDSIENASLVAAKYLIELGYKVLPVINKIPADKIRSVNKLRVKPSHEANVDFFFSNNEGLAILTGDNLEVIDLDCKYDLTKNMRSEEHTSELQSP